MSMNWDETEAGLYKESQRLKQKARELRKKRLELEQQRAAIARQAVAEKERLAKAAAEKAADAAKKDRDARIRSALLKMATIVKGEKLAFDAPFGWTAEKQPCFKLHDKESGTQIQIYTTNSGFYWV